MGKGKGKFKAWVGYIRPGTPMYEAELPSLSVFSEHKSPFTRATSVLPLAKLRQKFPFSVKIVNKKFGYVQPIRSKKRFLCYTKKKVRVSEKKANFFFTMTTLGQTNKKFPAFSRHSQFCIILYLCFNR
jgi:hypothetical protein